MTGSGAAKGSANNAVRGKTPDLRPRVLGLVSRDYNHVFGNGRRDFSAVLPDVLALLDSYGCDTVLFSLFGIIPQTPATHLASFAGLKHVNSILLEEFDEKPGENGLLKREWRRQVLHFRAKEGWREHEIVQKFWTLAASSEETVREFVLHELPRRVLGEACFLVCGETNGVRVSRRLKEVQDTFGLRGAIPPQVRVILNPVHDQMVRYEMKLKRAFLSAEGRTVVSVWNRGKHAKPRPGKEARALDQGKFPWTVFHDEKEMNVEETVSVVRNDLGVDLGVLRLGALTCRTGSPEPLSGRATDLKA